MLFFLVPYDGITRIKTEKLGLSCQNSDRTLKIGNASRPLFCWWVRQPYKRRAQNDFHSVENRWTNMCMCFIFTSPLSSSFHPPLPSTSIMADVSFRTTQCSAVHFLTEHSGSCHVCSLASGVEHFDGNLLSNGGCSLDSSSGWGRPDCQRCYDDSVFPKTAFKF